jgi:hypothetical protein
MIGVTSDSSYHWLHRVGSRPSVTNCKFAIEIMSFLVLPCSTQCKLTPLTLTMSVSTFVLPSYASLTVLASTHRVAPQSVRLASMTWRMQVHPLLHYHFNGIVLVPAGPRHSPRTTRVSTGSCLPCTRTKCTGPRTNCTIHMCSSVVVPSISVGHLGVHMLDLLATPDGGISAGPARNTRDEDGLPRR